MTLITVPYFVDAPFEAWKPYLFLVFAIISTIVSLLSPTPRHLLLRFIPPYIFTLWSLLSINTTTTAWSPPYLDYSLGVTCIVNLIILPRILIYEYHPLPDATTVKAQGPTTFGAGGTLVSVWRNISIAGDMWNNPRNIPRTKAYCFRQTSASIVLFGLQRVGRIGLLVFLHREVVQKITSPYFAEIELEDVSPDRESLIRRLVSSPSDITQYEVMIRLILPAHWMWMNYLCLECYHDILSIIFVCILQTDNKEDWPPLFGNIIEAYTVKRFWGKYWHRITARSMTTLAIPVSRRWLRCSPGSRLEKTTVAFMVFFLSGIAHAIVAWRTAEGSESRDIMFYTCNFAAAAVEILISRAFRRTYIYNLLQNRGVFDRKSFRAVGQGVGFIWVYLWFLWIVPKWQFPKIYRQRVTQLEMEMEFFFRDVS